MGGKDRKDVCKENSGTGAVNKLYEGGEFIKNADRVFTAFPTVKHYIL